MPTDTALPAWMPEGSKRHTNPDGSLGGWVAPTARVSDNARVSGNAEVSGNAVVDGNARVDGKALVYGNARVDGNARVYSNAEVFGKARVYSNAWVSSPRDVICAWGGIGNHWTAYRTANGWALQAGCVHIPDLFADFDLVAAEHGAASKDQMRERKAILKYLRKMAAIRGGERPLQVGDVVRWKDHDHHTYQRMPVLWVDKTGQVVCRASHGLPVIFHPDDLERVTDDIRESF